jgi:hypothetical protein
MLYGGVEPKEGTYLRPSLIHAGGTQVIAKARLADNSRLEDLLGKSPPALRVLTHAGGLVAPVSAQIWTGRGNAGCPLARKTPVDGKCPPFASPDGSLAGPGFRHGPDRLRS